MAQALISSDEKSPIIYTSKRSKLVYQTFCTNRNNTLGENLPLFDQYTNIYSICCVLGFKNGKRTPLESRESIFTLEQLSEDEWSLLISIAYVSSNMNNELLCKTKEILDICSEYAETGMDLLMNTRFFKEIYPNGKLNTLQIKSEMYNNILQEILALNTL